MGRPRKPTALKVVHGTKRKDRQIPNEPKPSGSLSVEPPEWLSDKAEPWWHRVRPILVGMQVATDADPIAVGMLCDALAEYVAARDDVLKEGATYDCTTEKGGTMIRAHPSVAIAADAWRRAKLMLTEFGLTPASRAKVSTAVPGPADPLEEWEQAKGAGS